MKKLLMLTAALLIATPVMAHDHESGDKGGKFMKMDADGNGSVSKDEFLAHKGAKFDEMDADGNGELSKEEAKSAWGDAKEKWKERKEKMKEAASEE